MDAMKILGSLLGGGTMSSGLGGQVIGGLLKGGLGGGGGGGAGGLGDVLGAALGGGRAGGSSGGGLGGMLGGALGGGRGGGTGLGGVLGTVAMAAIAKYAAGRMGGTGGGSGMPDLGALLGGGANLAAMETQDANEQAELLVEAMINAAKADGRIDPREEQKILEPLGELDPEEIAFLKEKLNAPLDAAAFARRVPRTMAREVYATSVLAVELDEQAEARYLHQLAEGLDLDRDSVNAIHAELGAPAIYR